MKVEEKLRKLFFEVGQLHFAPVTIFYVILLYILAYKAKRAILRKRSCPTSKKNFFLEILHFVSNIHLEAREAIKTR